MSKRKPLTVWLAYASGTRKATSTYHKRGLAVVKAPTIHGDFVGEAWSVTHVASGMSVTRVPSRAAAVRLLDKLAALTDWARPAGSFGRRLGAKVKRILEREREEGET